MADASAAAAAVGYSGTPLVRKLGWCADSTVCLINPPAHFLSLVEPIPAGLKLQARLSVRTTLVHLFTTDRIVLQRELQRCRERLASDAVVWVSWPKKASKVPTDVTEDSIRTVALPMGWVDVKVCAVDAVWSGLKLVVRKSLR
jgi:hypothetical protein